MNVRTQIDPFTLSYIEAALWTSSDDQESLDVNYGVDDIAPATMAKIVSDCKAFQRDHADDIGEAASQAGHDFWLTRNGHGAGFWDGDWEPEAGKRLTRASEGYREVDLYVGDDGMIPS